MKTIPNNKRTSGVITIPDLKFHYKATVIKNTWYWFRDRQVNQWNKIEDIEMNPLTYSHLIFDKGAKTIQWKKETLFNKCAGSTGGQHAEESKSIHSYL